MPVFSIKTMMRVILAKNLNELTFDIHNTMQYTIYSTILKGFTEYTRYIMQTHSIYRHMKSLKREEEKKT